MEQIYNLILKCKELVRSHSRKCIKVAIAEGLNEGYVRKILEFIFRSGDISVKLLVGTTFRDNGQKTGDRMRRRQQPSSSSIIGKAG
nr:unnamed protein product [Callosobruchus analis]